MDILVSISYTVINFPKSLKNKNKHLHEIKLTEKRRKPTRITHLYLIQDISPRVIYHGSLDPAKRVSFHNMDRH